MDNNCDGTDDEGVLLTFYGDSDGDGFGNADDCDDNNAGIFTGATEIPNNGIDEDCNGEDLISAVDEHSLERLCGFLRTRFPVPCQ